MAEAFPVYQPDYADVSLRKVQLLKMKDEYLSRDASSVAKARRVRLRGTALEYWDVHFPLEQCVSLDGTRCNKPTY